MKRVHGSRTSAHPEGVVDFSSNVNSFGPPESVVELLRAAPEEAISSYPDPGYPAVREALAFYTGRRPDEIMLANGSVEILYWLCYARRPERALVLSPGFCEYELAARAAGAVVEENFLEVEAGFALDIERAKEQASAADIVFVSNPNSPTGRLFTRVEILELTGALGPGALMLVDEAFMDFCSGQHELSCLSDISENLWVSRSLTKFFSLAGLRAGYMVAPGADILRMEERTPPWSLNRFAEKAILAALEDSEYITGMPGRIAAERERFAALLEETGLVKVYPSCANFLLVGLSRGGPDAPELASRLLKHGFLVRDASSFSGLSEKFIRLAVRSRAENEVLVGVLVDVWESGGA